jgi:Ca2+-binding RTX toxin-like protein
MPIYGTPGDDIISPPRNTSNTTIDAGDGNDLINPIAGFSERNFYIGGNGNDTIWGSSSSTIQGGNGDDLFEGVSSDRVMDGGDGFDKISTLSFRSDVNAAIDIGNPNSIRGFAGIDIANIEAIRTFYGNTGNDYILASDNIDHYIGGSDGNDTISGGGGNDTINGNSGNDLLFGVAGNDAINGDDGDDGLAGQEGNDSLTGGNGQDRLYGWTGNDILDGGAGYDNLYADDGNDTLDGGAGSDNMYGGLDSDLLFGGDDIDNLEGGSGNDTLRGGKGNDILSGEGNNNGVYYVAGVAGADTFAFDSLSGANFAELGVDRITDFQASIDQILLDRTIFTALPSALTTSSFQAVANINDAATSTGLIVYSQGQLFYNANGAAAGYGAGGAFATFDNPIPTLGFNDFRISALSEPN